MDFLPPEISHRLFALSDKYILSMISFQKATHTKNHAEFSSEASTATPSLVSQHDKTKSNGFETLLQDQFYADPDETLIFFDWDNTLFPTAELYQGWGKPLPTVDKQAFLSEDRVEARREWEAALFQYLTIATTLSNECCILTNAKRPWVTHCIDTFAPKLRPLLADNGGTIKVVYAVETLAMWRRHKGFQHRPVRFPDMDRQKEIEDHTVSKYIAMKRVAKHFYSRYPGQTWKNILSLGDKEYEHDAAQEVAFHHGENGGLRIKTIILPEEPTLNELTLRLRLEQFLLRIYVQYDGDIDIDFRIEHDLLRAMRAAF